MKTMELSGVIKMEYDKWNKIILVQSDGLKVDLLARIVEMVNSFGTTGQVNYWVSDKPTTKDEAVEKFLEKLYGKIEAEYETNSYYYSTSTGGGVEYDCELTIGGHNLYRELADKEGKFLIIELSFKGDGKNTFQ